MGNSAAVKSEDIGPEELDDDVTLRELSWTGRTCKMSLRRFARTWRSRHEEAGKGYKKVCRHLRGMKKVMGVTRS